MDTTEQLTTVIWQFSGNNHFWLLFGFTSLMLLIMSKRLNDIFKLYKISKDIGPRKPIPKPVWQKEADREQTLKKLERQTLNRICTPRVDKRRGSTNNGNTTHWAARRNQKEFLRRKEQEQCSKPTPKDQHCESPNC